MKKLLLSVVSICMIASLLCGCGNNNETVIDNSKTDGVESSGTVAVDGGSTNVNIPSEENPEEWFEWSDETTIIGFSDEGNTAKPSVIVIPSKCTKIEEYAFPTKLDGVKAVYLNNVEEIGTNSFSQNESLTEMHLSPNTRVIGDEAFFNCASMSTVEFPSTLEKIGYRAFYMCYGLKTIDLSNTKMTEISDETFNSCDGAESVKLPNTIETIGEGAFGYSPLLKEVDLGTGVKVIGKKAFMETAIETVTIPEGVTEIGYCTFNSCTNLTSIYLPTSLVKFDITSWTKTALGNVNICTVYVHEGSDADTRFDEYDDGLLIKEFY